MQMAAKICPRAKEGFTGDRYGAVYNVPEDKLMMKLITCSQLQYKVVLLKRIYGKTMFIHLQMQGKLYDCAFTVVQTSMQYPLHAMEIAVLTCLYKIISQCDLTV